MIELRWKMKERTVIQAVHPGMWGGPTSTVVVQHQVLEYRDRLNENIATEWVEVPVVVVTQS